MPGSGANAEDLRASGSRESAATIDFDGQLRVVCRSEDGMGDVDEARTHTHTSTHSEAQNVSLQVTIARMDEWLGSIKKFGWDWTGSTLDGHTDTGNSKHGRVREPIKRRKKSSARTRRVSVRQRRFETGETKESEEGGAAGDPCFVLRSGFVVEAKRPKGWTKKLKGDACLGQRKEGLCSGWSG